MMANEFSLLTSEEASRLYGLNNKTPNKHGKQKRNKNS